MPMNKIGHLIAGLSVWAIILFVILTSIYYVYNHYITQPEIVIATDQSGGESTSPPPPLTSPKIEAEDGLSINDVLLISSLVLNVLFLLYYLDAYRRAKSYLSGLITRSKMSADPWIGVRNQRLSAEQYRKEVEKNRMGVLACFFFVVTLFKDIFEGLFAAIKFVIEALAHLAGISVSSRHPRQTPVPY